MTLTDEEREQLLHTTAEVTATMQALVAALVPAVQAAAAEFRRLYETLQGAGLIDEDGKPVPAGPRPAWQSPYGPQPKGHHR